MKQALWSVYFKRRDLRRAVLPPPIRPLAAEDGLDLLRSHRDRYGGARRRRAILEAGGGNLHRFDETRAGIAARVRDLAGTLGIDETVLDRVPDAGPDALGKIAPGTDACVAVKTEEIGVDYDPVGKDSTLKVVTCVNRPFGEMQPLVDPQNWKRCSDFFEKSDAIDPRTMEPVAVPAPGKRWQLHEVFSMPVATFENILNVRFIVEKHRLLVEYDLYDSLSFLWFGASLPGVLERDSGTIEVVPLDTDVTRMTTTKTIRFRDLTPDYPVEGGVDQGQWLNYCAPAMLGLWIDEASQGRLCCHLGGH
jgi:hypothetical protein